MAVILEGKKVAESLYSKIILEASLLSQVPKLTVVLVGDDPASQTYVKSKAKKCLDLGFQTDTINLPASVTEEVLLAKIAELNRDKTVHGILVQLPLPKHIQRTKVLYEISPLKDVDGLHPDNAGRLVQGETRFAPCTPAGVMEMLRFYQIPIEGKYAVVLGRSEIVGKPMATLLLAANATVTVCHSKTKDLTSYTKNADILIAALGKPHFVTADMVKPGAVVIDVGIHRTEKGLCGDVDIEKVAAVASAVSPVPGGVGPMTIAMLMKNVCLAASLQAR